MKPTVLIVEDDARIAEAEQLILKDMYSVTLARDGEEGLNQIKELKPDIVVLDVMMPKMNGFEVCKHVREDPDLAATKIIMVTSKTADRDEADGMKLGADDYIMKPFEADELLHVVKQVLMR
ncbi:two-component system response regulator [Candidatus Woesearchaeota archaeon]|nr:two-component system response regulator [Candidatus Woesearchaeota archaeon]|tara:strand:- start:269 stop:634 length:366 start_codon:yes stop_codon:yes gene_type:complete